MKRQPQRPPFLDTVAARRLHQFGQILKGDDGDFFSESCEWRMPPARIDNLISHKLARLERTGESVFAVWIGPKEWRR